MATVKITPAYLRVELTPAEKFWGLHGDLTIEGKKVIGAQPLEPKFQLSLGMRLPGTGFPGLISMGSYWRPGSWAFVSWRKGQQPLQINLQGHKYSRIVIGVQDAAALAEEINTAITGC